MNKELIKKKHNVSVVLTTAEAFNLADKAGVFPYNNISVGIYLRQQGYKRINVMQNRTIETVYIKR